MNNKKTAYFTVTNYGYLYKAIALKESLSIQGIEDFKIFMFELASNIPDNPFKDQYEIISEEHYTDYLKLAFKYDVVEFTTSLKPTLTISLLNSYHKVIFLDPDTYVYSNFDETLSLLDENDIILTPHFITPMSKEITEFPDLDCLKYGGFNLGFFAVKKSANSLSFLKWWENRCIDQCYFETQNGLSTDQKWIVIANTYFDGIKTLKNYGYNVAYWNALNRTIEKSEEKFLVNGDQLVFIHFSSLIENLDSSLLSSRSKISFEQLKNLEIWKELFHNYINRIHSIKSRMNLDQYGYSYEKLGNLYITYTLRRFYGENTNRFKDVNPFKSKELESFALKYKLLSKKPLPNNLNEEKVSGFKLTIILRLYRMFLKLLGYRNDINLSRLHIYLSSTHRINNFFE